jgi:hypothetical protein
MEKDPCEPGMRTQFRTLADPLGLAVRHGHIGARAARLPAEVRKGSSGRFGSHAPRLSCSVWYADASSSPSLSLSGALDAPTADQACGYVRDAIESRGEVVLNLACLSLCDARGPGSARTDEQVRRAGRVLSAFGGAAAAARGDHPHYRPGRQAAGASRRLGRATSVSPAVPPVTRAHDQMWRIARCRHGVRRGFPPIWCTIRWVPAGPDRARPRRLRQQAAYFPDTAALITRL